MRRPASQAVLISAFILTFFLTVDTVFANNLSPFFYVAQRNTYSGVHFKRSLFIWPDSTLEGCSGAVISAFGKLTIEEGFDGAIYALLSEITVKGDAGGLRARTFSSRVLGQNVNVSPVFERIARRGDGFVDDTIPRAVFAVSRALLTVCACFVILPLKKSFFEQCAAALTRERLNVVKAGVSSHVALTGLAVIFLISVVGLPVALVVAALAAVLCLLGEIGVGIAAGLWVSEKLNVKSNVYAQFIIGAALIEAITFLPYVGRAAAFIVLPSLMEGVIFIGIFNKYIIKKLYILHK